ncbi:hypothetical protein [Massilia niastensis]|uniref:hypothetical protein n=1 Tax=Massilia niastensis TaxID=544911 RepID=UPI00037D101C|nr:hypothetical protein [Massilia niastensis]
MSGLARAGGATRFEFAVCAALVALLAGMLLLRLLDYRVQSERTAAYHVVGALRTALAARAAQAPTRASLAALAQENPIRWLDRKPVNYLGEYYTPDLAELEKGAWFFDRSDRSINYLLRSDTFSSGSSKLLKFKVKLSRAPHPVDIDGQSGHLQGLVLGEVELHASTNN